MENLKTPPVPERNKYQFGKMIPGDYRTYNFATHKDLLKAQVNAHNAGTRTGNKFVTRKNGLTLQVWCTAKPDPFFGEV